MVRFRLHILLSLLLWPLSMLSQSQDFVIENFHENTTDMSAATSGIKDLNGLTASLIRFAVRDTLFEFDANIGILKQEKKTGEVWLFVPQGTKRITVRHPKLGVLRDYAVPVSIVSKTTYDADIRITNTMYLQSLVMSSVDDSNISQTISEMPPDVSEKGNRIDDNVYLSREMKAPIHKERTPIDIHFLLGGGFNALSMMGPSVSVGLEAGKFLLEADYVVGTEKVEAVGIYYKIPRYYDDSALGEAYDYSASRFSVRLGPIVNMNTLVLAIPQVGVSMNMIKGKELVNELDEDAQFAESNPISAFAAMRLQIKVLKNLCLHITPQYDFSVAPDDVYKVLKEADKKIKSWSEGFSVNAGILLRL